MRSMYIGLLIASVIGLTGCGGLTPDNNDPDFIPSPTPPATLVFDERIQYAAGLAENPLLMPIRPISAVAERLAEVLAAEYAVDPQAIRLEALLRDDLGLSNLQALNGSLARDFGVTIGRVEAESLLTLADLVRYVQVQLGGLISRAIFERSSLYVNVVIVESYGEAVSLLCDSGSGIVAIPWLDGVSYAAATARECGEAALQAVVNWGLVGALFTALDAPAEDATPEVTAEAPPQVVGEAINLLLSGEPEATSQRGVVVLNSDLGNVGLSAVTGRVFCRLGYDDFFSWLLPVMMARIRGVDLQTAPSEIRDYATQAELLQAVNAGECAGAGLAELDLGGYPQLTDVRVADISADLPYAVYMYPLEVGLGVRLSLNEHIAAVAADEADGRALRLLLGAERIEPALDADFEPLLTYLESTRLDFAQLGN